MKKILSISFLLCLSVLTATAQRIYDYTVKDDAGKDVLRMVKSSRSLSYVKIS